MQALIAYVKFVGIGSPEGMRVPGMGLKPLPEPAEQPVTARGEAVYAEFCANCHKVDGQGEKRLQPAIGYTIPPLWGDDSFNAGAGMARLDSAAAYIHDNMPFGIDYQDPVLSVQQAWDVAAYLVSKPRSADPHAGTSAP